MKTIARMLHGSHLYGTNYENSDEDVKEIFSMSVSELITGASDCFRHTSPDDTEFFSLKKFAALLSQQQTNAIEMLFTPKEFILQTSPAWEELRANKSRLVSKNIMPFVGYAKQQARLYSEKGNSYNMLKALNKDFLAWYNNTKILFDTEALEYVMGSKGLDQIIIDYPQLISHGEKLSNNDQPIPYLQILNKQFECFCPINEWKERLQRMIDTYGERVKDAAANGAFDRKAMYHAIRITNEASELLETGNLIFPRPDNILILLRAVRFDEAVNFNKAQSWLENQYNHLMEKALPNSKLQETIDNNYLVSWFKHAQYESIKQELKM